MCWKVGERLSSCRLNKQRLINSLEAEVNERACLIESMGVRACRTKFHVFTGKALLAIFTLPHELNPLWLANVR